MQDSIKIWTGEIKGYKLLDSGNGEKLEEINGIKIVRAEPRAWWKTVASPPDPQAESLRTGSQYLEASKELETVLDIGIGNVKAKIKYKESSKHIGIFPEQFPQWQWISNRISKLETRDSKKDLNILNLFGYTGIASLVAAQSGARVTHVDASKQSIDWARENQKLSGLENAPIRWIVDDAIKFLKREAKRPAFAEASAGEGKKYDAVIMDPPSYGRGPKGEVWKIENKLPSLLQACREVLSDKPLFIIFNMYSTELSSISVANLLADMTKGLNGSIESGELAIKPQNSDRLLPMSIFAIWQK